MLAVTAALPLAVAYISDSVALLAGTIQNIDRAQSAEEPREHLPGLKIANVRFGAADPGLPEPGKAHRHGPPATPARA